MLVCKQCENPVVSGSIYCENCLNNLQNLMVKVEMIFVKGGTFQMGNNNGNPTESPSHRVTLSSFFIGRYPVSQKQWKEVMKNNPSHFKGDSLPVENINWYDAIEFCNALSLKENFTPVYAIEKFKTDKNNKHDEDTFKWIVRANWETNGYRLPTEAEWEFAAKGGNMSNGFLYSGSDSIDVVAWYFRNSGDEALSGDWEKEEILKNNCKTHKIGSKKPNELGIYNMSGNVMEWCWDWYANYTSKSQTDPKGAESGKGRVDRGGTWSGVESSCTNTIRYYCGPHKRYDNLGFRLARSKM